MGSIQSNPFLFYGWGMRSRTSIHGVRVRCPTIERSPSFLVRSLVGNGLKPFPTGVQSLKSKFEIYDIIKKLINQKIFSFKVFKRLLIGISS